ncbi:DUF6455 family protein [Pararhodobacter oceanensis]|uniref:DUF6455 domain-containing protein n=1 Tax=Pararhodobacter oceanensis TaxID=2172121 RepID=A0A2T8HX71_9RHOB|nr:DUF6455 family protein [Pararhodobacter oceanensis]PVH30027.1 hypothetical protein DDE20_00110 [Pararhodobacter oceanensis]
MPPKAPQNTPANAAPDRGEDLLIWEMVNAMEIDLACAIQRDELPIKTLGAMMRNCHACPAPRLCGVYLDSRAGRTAQAPSFCPNREKLSDLQRNRRYSTAAAPHKTTAPQDAAP